MIKSEKGHVTISGKGGDILAEAIAVIDATIRTLENDIPEHELKELFSGALEECFKGTFSERTKTIKVDSEEEAKEIVRALNALNKLSSILS